MDTYVYEYGSGLYVNLTNRCNNNCAFCLRHTNQGVGSHRLWLEHEPTAEQVIEKMQDLSAYEEVVFCGFGEPTLAWETLKQIAAYVKQQGKPVRVNTNGLGNLANGRDITPEATLAIVERQTPGIPEAMRAESMRITPKGCLSRSVAGIRGRTLIINLPGSKKAAEENILAVIDPVQHGLDMLYSEGSADCGR